MRKYKISILALIFLIVFTSSSLALNKDVPKPMSDFYVYDELGILSQESKDYIIQTNLKIYGETEAQIVVAIIDNLKGQDIFSYSRDVFRAWEIGGKGKDNGVLILTSIEDKQIWITTGLGIEGAIPDSKAKRIIENDIIPEFKMDNYEAGIMAGFNDIVYEVANEYNIDLDELNIVDNRVDGNINIFKLLGFIIFLIVIDTIFFKGRIMRAINRAIIISSMSNNRNNRRGGPPFMGGGFGGGSGGFGSSGGGGRTGGGGAGGSW